MTDRDNVEKKMNYVLEKQSSQKGGSSGVKKVENSPQSDSSPARKKVLVKVKKNASPKEKKEEKMGLSPSSLAPQSLEEGAKVRRVTSVPKKKDASSLGEEVVEASGQEAKISEDFVKTDDGDKKVLCEQGEDRNTVKDTKGSEIVSSDEPASSSSRDKDSDEKKDVHSSGVKKAGFQSERPLSYASSSRMNRGKRVSEQVKEEKGGSQAPKDEEISSCIIRDSDVRTASSSSAPQKRYGSIDELNKRPNIKAGNLSDTAKKYRYAKKDQDGKSQDGNRGRQGGQFGDRRKEWGAGQRSFDGRKNASSDSRGRGTGQGFNKKPFGMTGMSRPVPAPIPIDIQKSTKKNRGSKKNEYSRKTKDEEFFEEKQLQQKKKVREKVNVVPTEIQILETISVAELAKKMNLRASEIIAKLMENGMMVTVNQSIDSETVQIIASDYGCDVKVVSLYDETIIESASDEGAELKARPPIVTVMGHVDHGKTKTLDAIRSSNIAAGEFGGITQHIGAYTVSYNGKDITFLDTPGHEAFTMMRARGAAVTDIVVLVVAADDGVMPQTIEAINHAKEAKVPIIVAINKMDKPEANPDKVKNRLSELDLMPEDWGGTTMYVEISALKKQGISELLEAILLQAEVLELKANYDCRAEGKVIESKIDHGRGVVASIIVQKGVLREGDPYVAGIYAGHVRAIFNDKGKRISEALPSTPCEILGLDEMPNAGDPFQVTESEKVARLISDKRRELKRFEVAKAVKKVTLDNLYDTIKEGSILELKVIIKADVQGSVEALTQSLEKLSTPEIRLNVIHGSAGAINESDVMLATADSNVIIIGFNVRPTTQARVLAETEKVDIRKYTVIYQAVEEMKMAMEGMLSPDKKEVIVGQAEVRNVFKVSKIGNIAGLYVLEGNIKRSYLVNIVRDNVVIANSLKISSLKRFKDDVKEVAQGFECGLNLEGFNDLMVGDIMEFIEIQEVRKKLGSPIEEKSGQ